MHDVRIEKILCSVDFSDCSGHALQYALDFAREFEAKLILLHVVEIPFVPSYAMAGVPDLSLPVDQLEAGARERLDQLVRECREEHADVEGSVRTGTAFVEIIDAAREAGADLIVMGTHGRTGLRQLLIGSVAEKVVRKSPCPVLTVKHPSHAFEMP